MKKTILSILLLFSFALYLNADNVRIGNKYIQISVGPYDGSFNIDMRDDRYPQYASGQNIPNWTGSNEAMDSTKTNKFWNSNMVASATIYGIPKSITYNNKTYSIKNPDDISVKFYAECASGFNFVSQTNPTIVRPFTIWGIAKYRYPNNNQHTHYAIDSKIASFAPPNDNFWTSNAIAGLFSDQSSIDLWMDFIVSLPFDNGGITQSGVMVGGAQYPLIDANDYSALVSISVDIDIKLHNEADASDIYEFKYTKTLPVPFSGYSNAISDYEEDTTAVYINTTTANINLNREYTGRWIDIGEISFNQNFGKISNSSNPPSAKCTAGTVSRIFFSASSDPTVQNTTGFRFIHKNAGNVLTSNNSVPFTLRFEGTGNSSDYGMKYFDGKGYTSSSDLMGGIQGEYIQSYCDINQYMLHSGWSRLHFHTIDGNLSIMVEDNSDTMQLGSYYADVYVHIIADDLK